MIRDMKLMFLILALVPVLALGEPPEWSGNPDRTIHIKTVPGQMRYDLSEIEAEPGEKLKIIFDNPDDLQHNLLFLSIDKADKDGQKFAQTVWELGDKGIAMGWVPEGSDRVMIASRLLDPEAAEDLYLQVPTETGDYPFICSVPGHSLLMKGILKVRTKKKLLSEVKANVYEGSWKKLPDFAALNPVETIEVENNLISLDPAKKLKKFGMTFDAVLTIEKSGDYEFALSSDDGSRLIVDGEGEIEHDGIHPQSTKTKKLTLEKGTHSIRVLYFEGGGNRGLSLSIKPEKGAPIALSDEVTKKKKAEKPAPDPIMLKPTNPGEAVIYRNFITGSTPRGIAVGYPGKVNLCWDANRMNVSQVWQGAFMDASKHWEGRGQGDQKPAGYGVVEVSGGFPIQRLASLDEPWVEESIGSIKYERDTANPEKEISYFKPNDDYKFLGYRLDDKRFPTFRYQWNDLEVTDYSEPGTEPNTLVRTLTFKGAAGENAYYRVLSAETITESDASFKVGKTLEIKIDGAEPMLRKSPGDELLVSLDGERERIEITYHWGQN